MKIHSEIFFISPLYNEDIDHKMCNNFVFKMPMSVRAAFIFVKKTCFCQKNENTVEKTIKWCRDVCWVK